MPELLDRDGTVQLVTEIKAEVTGITGSMAKIFKGPDLKIGTTWAAASGDTAPYTQQVAVTGMLATDDPIIDMVPDNNYARAGLQIDAWQEIYRIDARDDAIIVYAHRPTMEPIPIKIVCIRPVTPL